MHSSHSDPTRPLRDGEAATSTKRPCRPAHDAEAREQRMQYERDLLHRNRDIEGQLDHALVESFPASDPLAVTPEGHFPVRDPQLADDSPGEPGYPCGPAEPGGTQDAPRHAGQGPRDAQRRPDPQTPSTQPGSGPREPLPKGATPR